MLWGVVLAPFASTENDIRQVDVAINARGFALDAGLASAIIATEHELASRAEQAAPVSGTVLASPIRLKRWLK